VTTNEPMILALPKGRILKEVMPIIRSAGIEPEADFDDPKSRKLSFNTNLQNFKIIRVRSFDVATFVAFGAAHMGVAGNDVLLEFDYPEIYAPLDLNIGHCRISVAELLEMSKTDDPSRWSHVRVATKYPTSQQSILPSAAYRQNVLNLMVPWNLHQALVYAVVLLTLSALVIRYAQMGLLKWKKYLILLQGLLLTAPLLKLVAAK
jgi:ATP phosphoribosyltransferase